MCKVRRLQVAYHVTKNLPTVRVINSTERFIHKLKLSLNKNDFNSIFFLFIGTHENYFFG